MQSPMWNAFERTEFVRLLLLFYGKLRKRKHMQDVPETRARVVFANDIILFAFCFVSEGKTPKKIPFPWLVEGLFFAIYNYKMGKFNQKCEFWNNSKIHRKNSGLSK